MIIPEAERVGGQVCFDLRPVVAFKNKLTHKRLISG